MVPFNVRHVALLLCPTILLSGCGSFSDLGSATRTLNQRLQAQLQPSIAAGQVALSPQRDGAQVTLLDPALVPANGQGLSTSGRFVLDGMVEGLLDPSLLQIVVTDPAAPGGGQNDARVQAVTQYLKFAALAPALRPAAAPAAPPAGSAPPKGLTIAISLHCPDPLPASGMGYGAAHYPTCR